MVKENTHLMAADKILQKIKNKAIKKIISENKAYYQLGAVAPDIFLYAKKGKGLEIAQKLHGFDKYPTNKIVFEMLDKAKKTKSMKELAFIFGYLTHTAMDITFHPVVYDIIRKNPKQNRPYLHRVLETGLDSQINNGTYIEKIIKPKMIEELSFVELTSKRAKKTLKRQIRSNILFKTRIMYRIANIFYILGLMPKRNVGLFYEGLKKNKTRIPNKVEYFHPIEGNKKSTIKKLMQEGIEMGVKRINSAFSYYNNKITKKQCSKIITGIRLDLGAMVK